MAKATFEVIEDKVMISVPRETKDFLDAMKWMNGILENGKWVVDVSHEKRIRKLCDIIYD